MPKKGKKGKKKKGKKKKLTSTNETPEQVVRRLLKTYERNCGLCNSLVSPPLHKNMRDCIENNQLLVKFIVEPVPPPENSEDPIVPVCLEPLVNALRQERYTYIKNLHIWDLPLTHEHMAALALLIEKQVYPLKHLEIMDCILQPYPLQRLARSFNVCETLSSIELDYNEFGDKGCKALCTGLERNKTVTSVSMNYCDLGVPSGAILGHMLATSAVGALYLDGNNLECEGAVELIKVCTDHAEEEAFDRAEAERKKLEADAEAAMKEKEHHLNFSDGNDSAANDKPGSASGKKKKKKGKKKKKKEPPPPPPVGPWIYKLHLADNGLDSFSTGGSFAPIVCLRLFKRLIINSKCLQELDLEDNLIGDLGGRELVEALEERKEAELPSMKLRTTHRMHSDTFNQLVKLGAGLKKKKKKRGKKKKKK